MKNGRYEEEGKITWYLNDKLHREDGRAIEWADGDKQWLINGHSHREDGPAVEYSDGSKYWWIDGKPHREDGPAVEYANGKKFWYLSGIQLSEEEFNHFLMKKELSYNLNEELKSKPTQKRLKI